MTRQYQSLRRTQSQGFLGRLSLPSPQVLWGAGRILSPASPQDGGLKELSPTSPRVPRG